MLMCETKGSNDHPTGAGRFQLPHLICCFTLQFVLRTSKSIFFYWPAAGAFFQKKIPITFICTPFLRTIYCTPRDLVVCCLRGVAGLRLL